MSGPLWKIRGSRASVPVPVRKLSVNWTVRAPPTPSETELQPGTQSAFPDSRLSTQVWTAANVVSGAPRAIVPLRASGSGTMVPGGKRWICGNRRLWTPSGSAASPPDSETSASANEISPPGTSTLTPVRLVYVAAVTGTGPARIIAAAMDIHRGARLRAHCRRIVTLMFRRGDAPSA
jgi:hypothetical protein